jgi:hypothetical protein
MATDDTALVIAVLDLVGASASLLRSVRSEASRATGTPPERILLACTHSHASPDTQGLWGGIPHAYERHIVRTATVAIADAWSASRPVRVRAASREFAGAVTNRRGWPDTDTTLTALRFDDAAGRPVATLTNFACHGTAIGPDSTEISRDWCGFTVDAIESSFGGVALFINGAVGDVIPASSGSVEHARALGESVAAAALESLATAEEVSDELAVRSADLSIPMNVERLSARVEQALTRGGFGLSLVRNARGFAALARALHAASRPNLAQMVAALAGMTERGPRRIEDRTVIPTAVSHIRFGSDLAAITAPGELLTHLASPLRAMMPARHRMIFGLTHDTLGYFVPEDEWMSGRNNNYEESVSLGRNAAAALRRTLSQLVAGGTG